MLVKITSDDPMVENRIELLKIEFKTFAASKAVLAAVKNYHHIKEENELLKAHNDSMQSEIDRLRELLKLKSKYQDW